jgi:hypothetical protein
MTAAKACAMASRRSSSATIGVPPGSSDSTASSSDRDLPGCCHHPVSRFHETTLCTSDGSKQRPSCAHESSASRRQVRFSVKYASERLRTGAARERATGSRHPQNPAGPSGVTERVQHQCSSTCPFACEVSVGKPICDR